MVQGTVRDFNSQGNYGFIEIDEGENSEEDRDDVFFHMDDIGGPALAEGQAVEFDIEQADRGPRATNLTRLNDDGEPQEVEAERGRREQDGVIIDEDGTRWVSINDL